MRAKLGEWLRRLADVVDEENALRTPGWGFRFEQGVGVVWVDEGLSNQPPTACRVWYFSKDYQYAHPQLNDGLEGEQRDHEIHTGDDDRVSDDDYFSL